MAARWRVCTRSGTWLLLYGTRLLGDAEARTAVIIQPATPHEVAPLMALAYGLSERETQITLLCSSTPLELMPMKSGNSRGPSTRGPTLVRERRKADE
nr:hypothetical protein [Rhodococcus opacus]